MRLTRLELEVMDALWSLGRARAGEIRNALPRSKRCAPTTVLTILSRLEGKGAVRRAGKIANAIVFEPTIARDAVHRDLVDDLLSRLGGVPALMAHMVDSGRLSLEDIRKLETSLAHLKRKGAAERDSSRGKR